MDLSLTRECEKIEKNPGIQQNLMIKLPSQKMIASGFGLALMLLGSAGFVSYVSIRQLHKDQYWIMHTDEVLEELDQVSAQMQFAEGERQSYGAALQLSERSQYERAFKKVIEKVAIVEQLIADNPSQTRKLEQLKDTIKVQSALTQQWFTELQQPSVSTNTLAGLNQKAQALQGTSQSLLQQMIREEQDLLQRRTATAKTTMGRVTLVMILGYGLGFILLGIVYALFRQKVRDGEAISKAKILLEQETAKTRIVDILESMTDAFVSLDRNWRYTYLNQRAGQLFGRDPQDLAGKNIWEEFPEGIGESFYHAYHDAIAEQKFIQLEEYYPPYDRWFENRIYPSQDGVSIFFQDVTLRKKAEIELQQAKDTLEIRVLERTNELAQTNDRLAQELLERQRAEQVLQDLTRKLEQSNQDLEKFAYIASHDLQEPLRAITSYTQLLQQEYQISSPDPALLAESMTYIVGGATQMRVLIKDLLTYSRVGSEDLAVSSVDCNQVMTQVLSALQVAIAETSATITYDALPTILADRSKLGQILQNLISNAIKFHQESPPIVHVSAQQYPQEWCFSVQDNGIGIKPQYLDRIFEVFRRLHTQREYPGTGIGLAICKKIVERQGGRIWVESDPGVGAVFHFTFPIQ
jgi:PAS domain S-box-containing protein